MILMVVTMRRRIAPFYRFPFLSCCPPIVATMLCSSRFTKSLAKGMERLGCVWRCGGGSGTQFKPLPSTHSTFPFGYLIQHGQLFDPSSPPFSLIVSPVSALTGLPSVIVSLPLERSFLAYAFPLLDMCYPRLSYLYLSSFPSLLCPPMCSYSFGYDHHHHHCYLLFAFICLEENTNKRTYVLPSCPVLPCLL